ncbi:MAG: AraC family transcriptional regulator, partial [Muribaculaceae bacterium]|nr:AraC family transcriptional regulator [Muribaculaceae bacterium]
MVCNHCVSAVRQALTELGLTPVSVELGRAEIVEDLTNERLDQLAARLEASGFELISDPTKDIVESIKREIIMMVRSDAPVPQTLSDYLSA